MSSTILNAIVVALAAVALPLSAKAERMTVAEYLSGYREATATSESTADENPFENLSLLPTAPDAGLLTESGLLTHRIAAPPTPPTPGSPAPIPTAFVVFESGTGSDYVREIACEPDTTVGRALKTQICPTPVDFSKAGIAIHRVSQHINDDLTIEAQEEILRVEWDATTNEPTTQSNHRLQPSDRLIVALPPSSSRPPRLPNMTPIARYGAVYGPPQPIIASSPELAATPHQPAPEAPRAVVYSALPAPVASPYSAEAATAYATVATDLPAAPIANDMAAPSSTVKFDVVVVEDIGDSFAEFEELRSRMPCMLTDTSTIQGTLRILEKHKLVRRVSSPKLMVAAGERASLAIGSETPGADQPWQGIKAEMGARELGGGLVVDFSLANTEGRQTNKVQTSLIVPHGQTVIMKTGSQLLQASVDEDAVEDKVQHAVYVVLTPEVVKSR